MNVDADSDKSAGIPLLSSAGNEQSLVPLQPLVLG
jgi:hypothetical protein